MIEMDFGEVRVTSVADVPLLLLRENGGDRVLPIWITAASANAILSAETTGGVTDSHGLIGSVLDALNQTVTDVRILDVVDGVFTAELRICDKTVACRPSDAVAIARRCGAPILATDDVLAKAGQPVTTQEISFDGAPDQQLEQFRAFLDTIKPEDFEVEPPAEDDQP